ncbi:MAG: type VI secretion system tube protein Hcp [Fuerstiella sp.]
MAFDAFLQIDGIPGESTDDQHKDWIEIKDYEHCVAQPISGSRSSGGGISGERVNHSAFRITKELDKASPKLALYCCNGSHISSVKMELCRAGGDKQKYMEVLMENVLVSKHAPQGRAGDESPLPIEQVDFVYEKITWTYTETDGKTGKAKGNVEAHWDCENNTGG